MNIADVKPFVRYPFADLPDGLPGYTLLWLRHDGSGATEKPAPQNVPLVVSWEPYIPGSYQFTELMIHERYSRFAFQFVNFMWLGP